MAGSGGVVRGSGPYQGAVMEGAIYAVMVRHIPAFGWVVHVYRRGLADSVAGPYATMRDALAEWAGPLASEEAARQP